MFLGTFDIFRIGIGPSSSHTVGPMVAAKRFLAEIAKRRPVGGVRLHISLHGSLAATGRGHGTDRALLLGLAGAQPDAVEPDTAELIAADVLRRRTIDVEGYRALAFDPEVDMSFDHGPPMPEHPNGMIFSVLDCGGETVLREVYFSIGGGTVRTRDEMSGVVIESKSGDVTYPFGSAAELLEMGEKSGLTIAQMMRANEVSIVAPEEVDRQLAAIWQAMNAAIERGLTATGELPGRLRVKRRAQLIHCQLVRERHNTITSNPMEWLSVFAMAVNEENAAGHRIVTAPTNGAAGVIPATLRYFLEAQAWAGPDDVATFLLVAGAIGSIIKRNASVSGAEVGCQGEVGSASAMAAAGICAVLGGTNRQVENAAEIALEHHLGMTCDPIAGLVQIPCIERNGFGAMKAVAAAALALRADGTHVVSLDACIRTMYQTGVDMNVRYKETSTGGLAVNVVEC